MRTLSEDFFKTIHDFFPFNRLLKLLLGLSIVIQVIVISYNHWSGYHELSQLSDFFLRLLRGVIMSLVAGFLIAYPDLYLIRYLNSVVPWNGRTIRRIIIQLTSGILIAVTISTTITSLFHRINPYREDFTGVLINNALIYSVVNCLFLAILEGWMFSIENRKAEQMAKTLKEELSQIKFEVLKSQINPHFMFNSLNVLSGLINKDVGKAQQFIDEFSQVYRYVLETIEQLVATVEKELDFMRSYLFLQQIRYGADLSYSITIPSHLLKMVLPPLSLQIVLENAIKHNTISEETPLKIEVFSQDSRLVVKNNLHPKISRSSSIGLGQKNLSKRYILISNREPVFSIETNHYIAELPLLDIEKDECTDH